MTLLKKSLSAVRRMVGYLRFNDDASAVYGEHPNGPRDDANVAGAITANVVGGLY